MAAPDLSQTLSHLIEPARPDGRGKVIAVASAMSGLGVSYVARQLALLSAESGNYTCLLDYNLADNTQYKALSNSELSYQYGSLGGPYDASFGVRPIWHVNPLPEGGAQNAYMGLYQLGSHNLFFNQFLWDRMSEGQSVHIAKSRDYIHALREHYYLTFIDCPNVSESEAGSTVFGEADGVIIVAPDAAHESVSETYQAISHQGGQCLGVVLNTLPQASKPQIYA